MREDPLIHKFPLSLDLNTTEKVESELLTQLFLGCLYWRTCVTSEILEEPRYGHLTFFSFVS